MQRLKILVIGLVLAAGSLLALATPANAVGCYGNSCTGKDPSAMGCSGRTLDAVSAPGVYIELRYSDACGAAWARSTGVNYGVFPQIWGSTSSQYYGQVQGTQASTSPSWTYMFSFQLWVRACYAIDWGGGSPQGCTPVH